jgi:hypothetical protein
MKLQGKGIVLHYLLPDEMRVAFSLRLDSCLPFDLGLGWDRHSTDSNLETRGSVILRLQLHQIRCGYGLSLGCLVPMEQ